MLRIALQMDPIEAVDINADTSYAFAREALARGHEVMVFDPDDLVMEGAKISALTQTIQSLNDDPQNIVTWAGDPAPLDLRQLDVLLIRQDPPFDMGYLTTTWILERLMDDVLVLNNPIEIRNAPEKILVTDYPDLTPPTLITRNIEAIKHFRKTHKDIIIKPLYGNGGAGVFRLRPDDENFNSLMEMFLTAREPMIIQAYLPAVRKGDKRIILLDGKPVGALNRIPAKGETRSNLHVGGRAEAIGLSPRDHEICNAIGPELSKRGLVFAGIDVIGDKLTEINVTSPTGIQEIKTFGGADIAALFWDWVEARQ
jgi:glutathione synthase